MNTIARKLKRVLSGVMRAGAAVSLAAKLLIPVGYMPGALADGGPFVLCSVGMPAVATAAPASHPAQHGGGPEAAGAAADPSDQHGSPGHHAAHVAHVAEHAEHAEHGHDPASDPESDHGPWERCALGGLASLVPITCAGISTLALSSAAEHPSVDSPALQGRSVGVVRARGPPTLTA